MATVYSAALPQSAGIAASPRPVATGAATPLGATVTADGVNFSVYSKHATRVELLLFES